MNYIHSKPKGSEISRYATYKQVEKSTGKTPKDLLNAPTLREELVDLWKLFCELPEYTYSELEAYGRLTGITLSPWEVDAIIKLNKYRGEELNKWPPKKHH